ncbi:acyltransferase family protein [Pseudofrankia inefficax]
MRFIAALLVFAFHAAYEFPFRDQGIGGDYSRAVADAGALGVGFFFVLSGFVLTWTARPDDSARRFWRRRAVKIYPNYVVAWIAAFVLMVAAGEAVTASAAVPNLLLVHAWVPRANILFSMDDVSWTLSCEALFYLAFPVLFLLVRRIRPTLLWPAAGLIVVVVLVLPLVAKLLPASPLFVTTPVWRLWLVYMLPPVRTLDFVLGMVMARILQTGKWIRVGLGPAVVLVAIGYYISLHVPNLYTFVAATIIPIALVIPAAAAADLRERFSPLRNRVMVWLGEISFAFYLLHRLILKYGHIALGRRRTWDTAPAVGLILLALALAITAAWLLHVLVEKPAMRRFAVSKHTRPAAPAEPAGAGPAVIGPAGARAAEPSRSAPAGAAPEPVGP